MTIDPTNPKGYRFRHKDHKIIAMYAMPEAPEAYRLAVISETKDSVRCLTMLREDGCTFASGPGPDDLIEHDPVLYYAIAYRTDVGGARTWSAARRYLDSGAKGRAIGIIAVHASGKVRQIPLDATTDPEESGDE
ncbi:MAG: hypothetical protein ACIAQU_04155 [Phycisphaerales bacterium JB064]